MIWPHWLGLANKMLEVRVIPRVFGTIMLDGMAHGILPKSNQGPSGTPILKTHKKHPHETCFLVWYPKAACPFFKGILWKPKLMLNTLFLASMATFSTNFTRTNATKRP